ncbi:hypothetical protein [Candidatus Xianfuyuplasma coldseepsis]|uniref:GIY-YIG domain-containing protein n=1 Tax=Candidatus Xianfuyuplasma coldseepsis TaxID=2782163 RepID=A0A7L7KQH3_9MOLU|nr:hypothetical protein [Xianfuyuplasma coldseepsis]QMS84835.1 hypothetical protein G4Z02_03390 [Xianfuyuplasma coldseepsis]
MADYNFSGFACIKNVLDTIENDIQNPSKFKRMVYNKPKRYQVLKRKDTKVLEPSSNNIYFIFDNLGRCQYIGKKENKKGINTRIKSHIVQNTQAKTKSCIKKIYDYIMTLPIPSRFVYYKSFLIEPHWMAPAVESYFITLFKKKGEAKWVKRK